jgi:hypothetical protein
MKYGADDPLPLEGRAIAYEPGGPIRVNAVILGLVPRIASYGAIGHIRHRNRGRLSALQDPPTQADPRDKPEDDGGAGLPVAFLLPSYAIALPLRGGVRTTPIASDTLFAANRIGKLSSYPHPLSLPSRGRGSQAPRFN